MPIRLFAPLFTLKQILGNFARYPQMFMRHLDRTDVACLIALLERVKVLCEQALPNLRNPQEVRLEEWTKRTEKAARVVKRADFEQPCADACGICLEHHPKSEFVACGCGHEYGRACFLEYVKSVQSYRTVLCPLCRAAVKTFRGFRLRKSRQAAVA